MRACLQTVSAVPHDLTASERARFSTDLLKGFRYVRLAMGLYLRGLTPDRQNIVERYPRSDGRPPGDDAGIGHGGRLGRILVAGAILEEQQQLHWRISEAV